MKKFTSKLLSFLAFLSLVSAGSEWAPLGQNLCDPLTPTTPTASQDTNFGFRVAMSELTNEETFVIAVGSPTFTQNHFRQGRVQFYRFSRGACLWQAFTDDLLGERSEDRLGANVAMSCNAQRVAVAGDIASSVNEERQGFVRVYERRGSGWAQLGQTLTDLSSLNQPFSKTNFGFLTMELSCDGNMVKVQSTGGIHVYEYNQANRNWDLALFRENFDRNNQLAYKAPVLAVREIGQLLILEKSGNNWGLKGANNITVPGTTAIDNMAIADDGTRVAVTVGSNEYVFDLLADTNTWNQTGRSLEIETNTAVFLSGDGDTLFGRNQAGIVSAARLFNVRNDPVSVSEGAPGQELQWLLIGSPIDSQADLGLTRVLVSMNGGAVVLSNIGRVEAYFYPEDTTVGGLDCYPNFEATEARVCLPLEEEEEEVQLIQGDIDVDTSDAAAATAIALACIAFCLAFTVLVLLFKNNQAGSENTAAPPSATEPPTMRQTSNEMKPLNQDDKDLPQDLTHMDDGNDAEDEEMPESYMSTDV